MKESIKFVYDGVSSDDMGLINVNVDGGIFEETFLATKDIREVKIRGNDKPYFLGIEKEPLVFDLQFAFKNGWDDEQIKKVARWLDADHFKEFYTLDKPDRIFFCMPIGQIKLVHNGSKNGYIEMEMRCDGAYSYSEEITSELYDFSINVVDGTTILIDNKGDLILKPDMWITKVGSGDVSIENLTTNEIFEIRNLEDNEVVFFDNEREEIESDIPAMYRFDDFNNNYLELALGVNELLVKGNCLLQFKYRFKTLT